VAGYGGNLVIESLSLIFGSGSYFAGAVLLIGSAMKWIIGYVPPAMVIISSGMIFISQLPGTQNRLELLLPGLYGFVIGGVLNLVFLLVTPVLTLLSRSPNQECPKPWRTTAARGSIWIAYFTLCCLLCLLVFLLGVLLSGLRDTHKLKPTKCCETDRIHTRLSLPTKR
jgi:hypothetical protein